MAHLAADARARRASIRRPRRRPASRRRRCGHAHRRRRTTPSSSRCPARCGCGRGPCCRRCSRRTPRDPGADRRAGGALGCRRAASASQRVADRAWEREWLKDFHAMRFGRRLWIVPHHEAPPADPAAVVVRLDPGLAFGTGTHPSTALCLNGWTAHLRPASASSTTAAARACSPSPRRGSGRAGCSATTSIRRPRSRRATTPPPMASTAGRAVDENPPRCRAPQTCCSPTSSPVRCANSHLHSHGCCEPGGQARAGGHPR